MLLEVGNAHMSFDQAVENFPAAAMNTRPPNVEYTPWHLLEHIRRTQDDILDFIRNPNYVERSWPESYWPQRDEVADEATWQKTIEGFHNDRRALVEIIMNPETDLYTPLAHGEGQNILREIQVVADHNAYHIGEFAILRQVMGTWRK